MERTYKLVFTEMYEWTWIDCPGHDDHVQEMMIGLAEADLLLILVAADEGINSQLRRICTAVHPLVHAKNVAFLVNKMDAVGYSQSKYDQLVAGIRDFLQAMPCFPKPLVQNVPVLPISALKGENLYKRSQMGWFTGKTLYALLDDGAMPIRPLDLPFRFTVQKHRNERGVGDIVTGRVIQGEGRPGMSATFAGSYKSATGTAFVAEKMDESRVPVMQAGDILHVNIKGFEKELPRCGDVMCEIGRGLKEATSFDGMVQVISGDFPVGSTTLAFVAGRFFKCKITAIQWAVSPGSRTREPNAGSLKAGGYGLCSFQPLESAVVENVKASPMLSKLLFFDEKNEIVTCLVELAGKLSDCHRRVCMESHGRLSVPESLRRRAETLLESLVSSEFLRRCWGKS